LGEVSVWFAYAQKGEITSTHSFEPHPPYISQ
jgi:hypothetical protein